MRTVALGWAPTSHHGWGIFATHVLRNLPHFDRRGALLVPVAPTFLQPADQDRFRQIIAAQAERAKRDAGETEPIHLKDTAVLHALGNRLGSDTVASRYEGHPNIGFTFFESTDIPPPTETLANHRFDKVMTGSFWNQEILTEKGYRNTACVHQGVDWPAYAPRPRSDRFRDRFLVFSGCKLEYRKGQDLVVAAFRHLLKTRPEALLITIWTNAWAKTALDMRNSRHVSTLPEARGSIISSEAIQAWTQAEGIPEGHHIDLGLIANDDFPEVLSNVDAAVFPSRAEGGTNLVLMEALAAGVPTVIAPNTGQRDVAVSDHAYLLQNQTPVPDTTGSRTGWRDSEPEEIATLLEDIARDPESARRRGAQARRFMKDFDWPIQVGKLVRAADPQ